MDPALPEMRTMLSMLDRQGRLAEVIAPDGGVDFIKEDEVLGWCNGNCHLNQRVDAVAKALRGYQVLYAPCVTADPLNLELKAQIAMENGATALHCNWWAGLGAFALLRERIPLPLFFQKSGERIITTGPHGISFDVLLQLVRAVGCDFVHVGMSGGYLDEDDWTLRRRIGILQRPGAFKPVLPSLSCGAHPGLVGRLRDSFGIEIMISAGGAIHGHPGGTRDGARAFLQAATNMPGDEYTQAVLEWGEQQ